MGNVVNQLTSASSSDFSDINLVISEGGSGSAGGGSGSTGNTNSAPTISGSPITSVTAGNLYNLTVTGSDSDGTNLSFNISNRPAWASFTSNGNNTATLSGTPQTDNIGQYGNITITVSDGIDTASLPGFTIEVLEDTRTPPPPTPPLSADFTATPTSGVVSLTVSFRATQSDNITGYLWDFGDGDSAMGPTQTHIYSQPGSYTVQLTVANGNGDTDTMERTVNVFTSVDNTSVIVPNGVLFYDNFDYVVGRDSADAITTFQTQGGWDWGKSAQAGEPGAKGYLYTVDRIPGYSGAFPGRNSTRVLVQEAAGATFGGQTDFFLQYGSTTAPAETIPGDVWFQFWVYPNYYDDPNNQEDQLSDFGHRMKFLYPCKSSYPCQDATWLFMMGATSDQPFVDSLGEPSHDLYVVLRDAEDIDYALADQYPTNRTKLGQTDISDLVARNRWTLVKLHMDTSTTSGKWEAWVKPMGGEWLKVADWVDGQNALTWTVSVPGGHRVLRMPTTIGGGGEYFDSWLYMDDFAMAGSESDLPVYPY